MFFTGRKLTKMFEGLTTRQVVVEPSVSPEAIAIFRAVTEDAGAVKAFTGNNREGAAQVTQFLQGVIRAGEQDLAVKALTTSWPSEHSWLKGNVSSASLLADMNYQGTLTILKSLDAPRQIEVMAAPNALQYLWASESDQYRQSEGIALIIDKYTPQQQEELFSRTLANNSPVSGIAGVITQVREKLDFIRTERAKEKALEELEERPAAPKKDGGKPLRLLR
jgi:hypothetical protein